jgi:hypothetical protein
MGVAISLTAAMKRYAQRDVIGIEEPAKASGPLGGQSNRPCRLFAVRKKTCSAEAAKTDRAAYERIGDGKG